MNRDELTKDLDDSLLENIEKSINQRESKQSKMDKMVDLFLNDGAANSKKKRDGGYRTQNKDDFHKNQKFRSHRMDKSNK